MTDEYSLHGKVALITGAGRGFGLGFARGLAEQGAIAIVSDLDAQRAESAAASLRADGLRAHAHALDVSDSQQVENAARQTVETFGALDIWINNAGISLHGASETLALDAWQLCINVMLSGVFYGCQSAGRIMLEQGGGSIINIASVNGFVAQAGRAAYCAAKAGVIRLTEVLAAEWSPRHVRVNAVAPAVFMTDMVKVAVEDGSASLGIYLERSPSGRLGDVPELVHTILYLASERSSYVTGQTLRVDGGWVSDHYL